MREEVARNVLEVGGDEVRRATPSLGGGDQRLRLPRRGRFHLLLKYPLSVEQILNERSLSIHPPAGAKATTVAARPRAAS